MKIAILALPLATACASNTPSPAPTPTPAIRLTAAQAARIRPFAPEDGPALLAQCSRDVPHATVFFRPTPEQVAGAERAVPAAVSRRSPDGPSGRAPNDLAALHRGWRVEAVGLVQGTRRSLYLNYVPRGLPDGGRSQPTVVCDGGPAFFGIQVDIHSGTVLQLAFNGMA